MESIASRSRDGILPLSSIEATSGELCPVLGSQNKRDMELMEQVQQWAMKMMKGHEYVSYEKRPRELDLFSLEKRKLRGELISVCQHLKGGCQEDGARLYSVLPSNGKEAMGRD
ncbi:hypothetical protein TURU_028552 [Turdus rufiventris]|nr:hypothetical protein TURU_028552 [Turdus rufiventris]